MPIASILLAETSESESCENLLRVSSICSLGLEVDNKARARGTALFITTSPYLNYNNTIYSLCMYWVTHTYTKLNAANRVCTF